MIPTMILIGLLAGLLPRPWHVVVFCCASVAWPLLLAGSGTIAMSDPAGVLAAWALGGVNAAVGVAVSRGLAGIVHRSGIARRQERP